jgi:voltage-gated potassium channel
MRKNAELNRQRNSLLHRVEQTLEGPMIILGFIWLVLLVVELIWGLTPVLEMLSLFIWIIFIVDFLLKFLLAPQKLPFIKKNWLTVISLMIPALRVVRIFRFVRLLRGLRGIRLVKIVASLNRSMRSLNATMRRRGFGYVILLTVLVMFGGAAGMFAFEKNVAGGLENYGKALWWTAMLIITIGSEYWPQTAEGRTLCFLLSLYGFSIFGYITATLASFFIGRDAEEKNTPVAGAEDVKALQREIQRLANVIEELKRSNK